MRRISSVSPVAAGARDRNPPFWSFPVRFVCKIARDMILGLVLLFCMGCCQGSQAASLPPATLMPRVPAADTRPQVLPPPVPSPAAGTLQPVSRPTSTLGVTPFLMKPSATVTTEATLTTIPDLDQACPIEQTGCILDGHFLMQRPIPPTDNLKVDATYRYGSTQAGTREPHHGVELPNVQGTPVLAVADGTVVFAGNDKDVTLSWVPAFYGNVVVIVHHFPGVSQPVFSLYAHLSEVNVVVREQVYLGDQIGRVGSTGKAIGSHLHFEVRLGSNDYLSNRNPELWLAPLPGMGVLAGRIQSLTGNALDGIINVQRIDRGVLNPLSVTSLETYVTREHDPVNADDVWRENFAAGEIPAGDYRLSIVYSGGIREQYIKIEPGKLTFVRFVLN